YGPAGDCVRVIASPSGSEEPSSIGALAVQLAPAETVTLWHAATGGLFLHLPALSARTMAWISAAERARLNISTSSIRPLKNDVGNELPALSLLPIKTEAGVTKMPPE